MMHGRLEEALRAGLFTLLLGLLCAATFAVPRLATEQGFGHGHPHGSEPHLHPFKLVLGQGEEVVPVLRLEPDLSVQPAVRPSRVLGASAASRSPHHSRAPPA